MKNDNARGALMAVLIEGGASFTEVGEAYGISRTRVGQLVDRAEDAGVYAIRRMVPHGSGGRADPIRIMRAVRMANVCSYEQVGLVVGVNKATVYHVVQDFGLRGAVKRLFEWRARRFQREYCRNLIRQAIREDPTIQTYDDLGRHLDPTKILKAASSYAQDILGRADFVSQIKRLFKWRRAHTPGTREYNRRETLAMFLASYDEELKSNTAD